MRSFIPFTLAVLAKEIKETTDPTQLSGLKHAHKIIESVTIVVDKMSADGFTDPRAIVAFQDSLYEVLTGQPRNTALRTELPLEEWDREANSIFPEPRSSMGSTLSPNFEASVSNPRAGGVAGN